MKPIWLFFSFLTSVTTLTAQTINTGKITATVKNENQHAMENATVQLLKSKDSSLVKVAITDNKGVAEFEHIIFGYYLLKATMVNHAPLYSAPVTLSYHTINQPGICFISSKIF